MTRKVALYGLSMLCTAAFVPMASAADLPSRAVAPVYAPPAVAISWTGFYAGVNAGYEFGAGGGTNTGTTPVFAAPTFATELTLSQALATGNAGGRPNGFIGGGQIGYNYQIHSNIVAGFEADIQGLAGAKSTGVFSGAGVPVGFPAETITSTVTATKRVSYIGTVRGRLGYTITPAFLVYATGGFAYGGVNSSTTINQNNTGLGTAPFASSASQSHTGTGYTVGGGLEYKISPNLSAKLEYLYYDLGSVRYGLPRLANAALYASDPFASARFKGNIVRVGLNYDFTSYVAPVVARY